MKSNLRELPVDDRFNNSRVLSTFIAYRTIVIKNSDVHQACFEASNRFSTQTERALLWVLSSLNNKLNLAHIVLRSLLLSVGHSVQSVTEVHKKTPMLHWLYDKRVQEEGWQFIYPEKCFGNSPEGSFTP